LVAVAGLLGYAWRGASGAAIGVVAVVVVGAATALSLRFMGAREFQRLYPVLMTTFAAAIGYAEMGVFGLVLLGILGGVGSWIGSRIGRRFTADNERWLGYRRSRRHQ
jgi:hypothetical protein